MNWNRKKTEFTKCETENAFFFKRKIIGPIQCTQRFDWVNRTNKNSRNKWWRKLYGLGQTWVEMCGCWLLAATPPSPATAEHIPTVCGVHASHMTCKLEWLQVLYKTTQERSWNHFQMSYSQRNAEIRSNRPNVWKEDFAASVKWLSCGNFYTKHFRQQNSMFTNAAQAVRWYYPLNNKKKRRKRKREREWCVWVCDRKKERKKEREIPSKRLSPSPCEACAGFTASHPPSPSYPSSLLF